LNVFEPSAVDLDDPVGNRVAKRVRRHVAGIAGSAAGAVGLDRCGGRERPDRPL